MVSNKDFNIIQFKRMLHALHAITRLISAAGLAVALGHLSKRPPSLAAFQELRVNNLTVMS